ncbi:methionyl-tRNA formyltransferase [Candidatus Marinamargulisbacteria bacterium SCGC AG-410-N11]|nr:methionyl-tRNA formyltransferase [Candidatus Marinamargulisbacteria bacterium SCGC AG-410-N11]
MILLLLMTKILFLGSPDFATTVLKKIYSDFSKYLVGVISQPDAAKGRGLKLFPTPVKAWSMSNQIPVFTPDSKTELSDNIQSINPDLVVVVAYGMILPKQITDNYVCINAHASLLPSYRGASPIHSSLLNQDSKSGVTIIQMNEKMDEGPIISKQETLLTASDNFETLHNRLAAIAANLCHEFISNFIKSPTISTSIQNHQSASYCKKLSAKDYQILSTDSPKVILGKIKAFSPKPGAFIIRNDRRIKIINATLTQDQFTILTVKPEGKKEMSYHDFCLGNPEGITLC